MRRDRKPECEGESVIISDQHKFAFIHIPKCGGTSVTDANPELRTQYLLHDLKQHEALGVLQWPLPVHLPLWALAKYFPGYFDRICEYSSFAVVRDPYERFASATIQHCREFLGQTNAELAGKRMITAARKVVQDLQGSPTWLDSRYVHFIPQHQYVFHDDRRIVGELDLIGQFDRLNGFLESKGLNQIAIKVRKNPTVEPATEAVALVLNSLKPIYRRVLPEGIKKGLWQKMIDMGVYTSRHDAGEWVRKDAELSEFVRTVYAKDFQLFDTVANSQLGR